MKSLFSNFQKRWIGKPLTAPSGVVAPPNLGQSPMPGGFKGPAYKQDLRFMNGTRP